MGWRLKKADKLHHKQAESLLRFPQQLTGSLALVRFVGRPRDVATSKIRIGNEIAALVSSEDHNARLFAMRRCLDAGAAVWLAHFHSYGARFCKQLLRTAQGSPSKMVPPKLRLKPRQRSDEEVESG